MILHRDAIVKNLKEFSESEREALEVVLKRNEIVQRMETKRIRLVVASRSVVVR